jgi:hypothetical protein
MNELELMRTILTMTSSIERIKKNVEDAHTIIDNGKQEYTDLEEQLELRKQELITLLTQ